MPRRRRRSIGITSWLAPAIALALLAAPGSTQAALVLSLSPSTVNATAGDVGQVLDVFLTNNTGSTINLGTFSFELLASSSNLTLAQATTSVTNYVFSVTSEADAFYGGVISPVPPGPLGPGLSAIDNSLSIPGEPIADGETVGLGHVLFNIAISTTPGSYGVTFQDLDGGTSLADAGGNSISLAGATVNNATVIVSAIPEPSSMTLAATLAVVGGFGALWKRRVGPSSATT